MQHMPRPLRNPLQNTFKPVRTEGADLLPDRVKRLALTDVLLDTLSHAFHGPRQATQFIPCRDGNRACHPPSAEFQGMKRQAGKRRRNRAGQQPAPKPPEEQDAENPSDKAVAGDLLQLVRPALLLE